MRNNAMRMRLQMLALSLVALALPAHAQTYPNKPVRFISAFAPGGGSEIALRIVAQKLIDNGWPSVVVENRPGGGGVVAAQATRQSPPDGYTILQADAAAFAINVSLIPNLPYDPVNDFAPIMLTWSFPSVLTVPAGLPAKTLAELLALANNKPGGISYASSGVGSGGHLLGTMLANASRAPMTHVPYKGAGQAMPDVVAGRVDFIFASLASVKQYLEAGSVRVLAVTAKERLKELPDVPTMTEAGYPSVFLDIWFGLVAPLGTPPDIVKVIHTDVSKVMRSPDVVKRLADMGLYVTTNTPEEFRAMIKGDIARLGQVVREANIKQE
jgi:tripartite-type tricarboxylate transporter receptor subunit TctC